MFESRAVQRPTPSADTTCFSSFRSVNSRSRKADGVRASYLVEMRRDYDAQAFAWVEMGGWD